VAHVRVLNHYLHSKFLFLACVEFCLLMLAVVAGVELRNMTSDYDVILPSPILQLFAFSVVMSCCSLAMGVYTSVFKEGLSGMVLRTVVGYFFLGTAILTVIYFIFPVFYLGRGVLAFAILFSLAFVIIVRVLFFKVVDLAQLTRKVIILGSGNTAQEIVMRINPEHNQFGFDLYGCVPCGHGDIKVDQKLVLAAPTDWRAFVDEHDVSEIVVAPDERRSNEGGELPIDALLDCKLSGTRVTDPLTFFERELLRVEVSMLRPSWALFSEGFVYSQLRDITKRMFDLAVASLILLLMWPFMLLTAIAVKLESKGSALYTNSGRL